MASVFNSHCLKTLCARKNLKSNAATLQVMWLWVTKPIMEMHALTNASGPRHQQAVVRGTTNPTLCSHTANDTDLLTPVLWAMAGDNKQIDLYPADPFIRIDPKFNQVVPWSLHSKFHANWSRRFLVILLTLKQRKKSPENNTPYRGRGNKQTVTEARLFSSKSTTIHCGSS